MPDFIQSQKSILDKPLRTTEGKQSYRTEDGKIEQHPTRTGAGVFVSAEYTLNYDSIGLMGGHHIVATALGGMQETVKKSIANSVLRAYAGSGLRVRSGRLIRAAEKEFTVEMQLRGQNRLVIIAYWHTDLPYFMRRLFGYKGMDSLGRKVRGVGMDTRRPRGYFIKFDGQARREIRAMIEDRLKLELQRRGQRIEATKRTEQLGKKAQQNRGEDPRLGSKRLTAHRVRRELRKAGAAQGEARELAKGIMETSRAAYQLQLIQRILRDRRGLLRQVKALSGRAVF